MAALAAQQGSAPERGLVPDPLPSLAGSRFDALRGQVPRAPNRRRLRKRPSNSGVPADPGRLEPYQAVLQSCHVRESGHAVRLRRRLPAGIDLLAGPRAPVNAGMSLHVPLSVDVTGAVDVSVKGLQIVADATAQPILPDPVQCWNWLSTGGLHGAPIWDEASKLRQEKTCRLAYAGFLREQPRFEEPPGLVPVGPLAILPAYDRDPVPTMFGVYDPVMPELPEIGDLLPDLSELQPAVQDYENLSGGVCPLPDYSALSPRLQEVLLHCENPAEAVTTAKALGVDRAAHVPNM